MRSITLNVETVYCLINQLREYSENEFAQHGFVSVDLKVLEKMADDAMDRPDSQTAPVSPFALTEQRVTKGELAERLYKGITYDTALPQPWVNQMASAFEEPDVASHFVWLYPDFSSVAGFPAPLTLKGIELLHYS